MELAPWHESLQSKPHLKFLLEANGVRLQATATVDSDDSVSAGLGGRSTFLKQPDPVNWSPQFVISLIAGLSGGITTALFVSASVSWSVWVIVTLSTVTPALMNRVNLKYHVYIAATYLISIAVIFVIARISLSFYWSVTPVLVLLLTIWAFRGQSYWSLKNGWRAPVKSLGRCFWLALQGLLGAEAVAALRRDRESRRSTSGA